MTLWFSTEFQLEFTDFHLVDGNIWIGTFTGYLETLFWGVGGQLVNTNSILAIGGLKDHVEIVANF